MGAFLDKPNTEIHKDSGSGNGLKYGLASMQGWRVNQEDAHTQATSIPQHADCSWFAVFDGHGGKLVSNESSTMLLDMIKMPDKSPATIKSGVRSAFLELDKRLRELPEVVRGEDHSGSTAIGAMITPEHIVLCNCGDSRAIIVRDGSVMMGSEDHKPYNPQEQARIRAAGGHVSMQRVNGDLAVSRALGDFVYKQCESKPDVEQQVSPEPEFLVHERAETDSFVVLACDGIWDVMSNEEVAEFVHRATDMGQVKLEDMAAELIKHCLALGSRDNMSAIIVRLPGAPTPSAEAVTAFEKSYGAKLRREEVEGLATGETEQQALLRRAVMSQSRQ